MLEVAAKSRRARSVVYVRVTYAHEPEVEHLLAVSPVSGEVSLAGPHPLAPPEQAIPPLAEAVEMETEPYTRAMRKRGTPAVGDVDYRQDSINRHVEEVETKASKLGARYGALAGAALGLAGGLLSAWIAFKAGWTP